MDLWWQREYNKKKLKIAQTYFPVSVSHSSHVRNKMNAQFREMKISPLVSYDYIIIIDKIGYSAIFDPATNSFSSLCMTENFIVLLDHFIICDQWLQSSKNLMKTKNLVMYS